MASDLDARKRMFIESKARIEAERLLFKVPASALRDDQKFDDNPTIGSIATIIQGQGSIHCEADARKRKFVESNAMIMAQNLQFNVFKRPHTDSVVSSRVPLPNEKLNLGDDQRMSKLMKVYEMAKKNRARLILKYGKAAFEMKIPEGLLGPTQGDIKDQEKVDQNEERNL